MRILQLDLIKFGAFDGATLDFSAAPREQPGFHLIYGPNEAGKSTARRAMRCALFGFSQRAEFDFLHDKKALRLGLTIEDAVGQSHRMVRRRGNKNTLLDPTNGTPISDGILSRVLAGVESPDEYERAFAIGHLELRAGGDAMLEEDNASGILAMAASGLGLKQVEREFLETAEQLYKPGGKKQAIKLGFTQLKELKQTLSQVESRADDYRKLESQLREVRDQHDSLQQQLSETRREQARLVRLRDAKPTLAKLRQRQGERQALGSVPDLEKKFTTRRIDTQKNLSTLGGEIASLKDQASRTDQQRKEITIRESDLAAERSIDRLYQSLESYRKAKKEKEPIRGEITKIERDINSCLQQIERDASELDQRAVLVTNPDAARIRELANRRTIRDKELSQQNGIRARLRDRLLGIEEELQSIPEPAPLADLNRAIQAAHRAGPIDEDIQTTAARLSASKSEEERLICELPDWSRTAETLQTIILPADSTIEAFRDRFARMEIDARQLTEQRFAAQEALDTAQHELATIEQNRDVPSEALLDEFRARRETGWREIRRELAGEQPGPEREEFLSQAAGKPLAEAYEESVRNADSIADRLRREADIVGKIARCQADASRAETKLERIASSEDEHRRSASDCDRAWRETWPFLDAEPRSVSEMRAWLTLAIAARDQIDMTRRFEQEHQTLVTRRAELRSDLLDELRAFDNSGASDESPLAHAIEIAENICAESRDANLARVTLTKEFTQKSEELVETERELETLHLEQEAEVDEWAKFMSKMDLPAETSQDAAIEVMKTLIQIDDHRRVLADKQQRVQEMEDYCVQFEHEVATLATELDSETTPTDIETFVTGAKKSLDMTRQQADRQQHLHEHARQLAEDIETKTASATAFLAEQDGLCRQAGCHNADELPAIEANAQRVIQLDEEIAETSEELLLRGGGCSLEDFQQELDEANVDDITARLEGSEPEIKQLAERQNEIVRELVTLEQRFAEFDGQSKAAAIADEIAGVKAKIVRQVEQYARARLAARLLRESRARYRQKAGNSLLVSASTLFSLLTCGAFAGVRIDFDDKDQQSLLVGIRAKDESSVDLDGMSDGTRDQLYLALRLAWLHDWMDQHGPLPLILDDLLIHFDDQRAAAALDVLAKMSQRTQILFLTHHDHLRHLARQHVPADCLHEHQLTSSPEGNGALF